MRFNRNHIVEAILILRYGKVANYPLLAGIPQNYHRAVLMRIAYSARHNFFYARIPKAGNSTVVGTLVAGMHSATTARAISAQKTRLNWPPTLRQFNRAFRFTFVRNPTDRIISAFLDKSAKAGGISPDRELPDEFVGFLERLKETDYFGNGHFLPQCSLMPGGLEQMEFVGRLERIDEDLTVINQRVFGAKVDRVDHVEHKTDANSRRGELLTKQSVELIRDLYRIDFERLKYAYPEVGAA